MTSLPHTVPATFLNRDFLLLWGGQFITRTGTSVASIVLVLWIKEATESATLMGLMGMLTGIAAVLFGVVGGTAADRLSRRRIISLSDAFSGIGMLLLSALFFIIPLQTEILLLALVTFSMFAAIADSFSNPAITAAVPDLVPHGSLTRANSTTQVTLQLAALGGTAIAGILYREMGVAAIAGLNGLLYLIAAVAEWQIRIPSTLAKRRQSSPDAVRPNLIEDSLWKHNVLEFHSTVVEGVRVIWQTKGLRELVVGSAALAFFSSPVIVLLPFYVLDVLSLTEDWVGFLSAAYGAGSMLGFLLAGLLQLEGHRRSTALLVMMFLGPTLLGVLGFVSSGVVALLLLLVGGVAGGFVSVYIITIIQLRTPSDMRGRMFGYLATISGSLAPLGMAFGGVVFDWTGQNVTLIFLTCGLMMLLVIGLIAINPRLRSYLGTGAS